MRKKLAYTALTVAMAGGMALSSAGAASAAHRYCVQTGNGSFQTTSASATDNANDSSNEQSGRSADGQKRAAENSPAIEGNGTGANTPCPTS